MPDITMCKGGDCPQRERCYRFTATPTERRQAYFAKPPYRLAMYGASTTTALTSCDHFSPTREP